MKCRFAAKYSRGGIFFRCNETAGGTHGTDSIILVDGRLSPSQVQRTISCDEASC